MSLYKIIVLLFLFVYYVETYLKVDFKDLLFCISPITDLIVKLYVLLVIIGVIPLKTNTLISVLLRAAERANNLNVIFLKSVDISKLMICYFH